MFLPHLDENQKLAFLQIAKQFISAAREFSRSEESLLHLMKLEMGLSPDVESLKDKGLPELCRYFDSRQSQATVLLEILGLGYADANFNPEEDAFVREVAKAFGVAKGELAAMQDWVVRQVALAKEAQSFLAG